MHLFDTVINRRNSNSVKWDGGELIKSIGFTERFDDDTLPLFIADMDFPVAEPIVQAMQKVIDKKIFGYSIIPNEYYQSIQNWFSKKYNWHIEKQHIVYSPGTVNAINTCVKAFTEPGDGIIIQRPSYPPFAAAIENNGRTIIDNHLVFDENYQYQFNFEDLEIKAQDPKNKLLILCNPHNPTGRIFTREELLKISEISERNNLIIISDEIHGDLIRKSAVFHPLATITDYDNLITLTAINKTFNVAGLHCSNTIIQNEELRKKYETVQGMQSPTPFTIAALIAAYNECDEWLNQLKEYLDGTFEWVNRFLSEQMPQVKYSIPEGTYVLWMDFSGYKLTPQEVHDRIYNKANVVLEDGKMFGKEYDDFQRICLPSPRSLVQEAFERIAKEFN